MIESLIFLAAVLGYFFGYFFGGTITCGLFDAKRDDAFWLWLFWPLVLFGCGLIWLLSVVGQSGFWIGKRIRGLF